MEKSERRAALAPLGLLVLSGGAYWSVLMGVVPVGLDAPLIFAAIAGTTALCAVGIGARAPALTAGVAALGFSLAAARGSGILSIGEWGLIIGATLATLGVLSYAASMVYHIGTRAYSVSPV
jgi:hypothetical protein